MSIEIAIQHDFGGFRLDASFSAGAQGVCALFGPSGAGKTSIINAVAGLFRPQGGRIVVDGYVLFDSSKGICRPAMRRSVGYVFQDARLFPHLSVRSNLTYGWKRRGKPGGEAAIPPLLDMLGIGHLLERRPGSLSGGERQRVALGRTLLTRPRLLLLDEPLSALDEARRGEILPYLERLRDEARVPMLYVSHAVVEVARLADQVVVLENGRVTADGPVEDVLARADLKVSDSLGGASAVFPATVQRHEESYALTVLDVPGGILWVPRLDAEPGHAVRVRVRAVDVAIALTPPEGYSANNVLPALVTDLKADGEGSLNVQLTSAGHPYLSRVTRLSAERLGLAVGQEVYAVIKSVQMDR